MNANDICLFYTQIQRVNKPATHWTNSTISE